MGFELPIHFRLALSRLTAQGVLATQATSPFFAPEAFWCIVRTVESVAADEQRVRPYHLNVPSFGEWGFVLVAPENAGAPKIPPGLDVKFLDPDVLAGMFQFPGDMQPVAVEPNRLTTAVLAGYYRDGWSAFH
jgi:spermidine synthase